MRKVLVASVLLLACLVSAQAEDRPYFEINGKLYEAQFKVYANRRAALEEAVMVAQAPAQRVQNPSPSLVDAIARAAARFNVKQGDGKWYRIAFQTISPTAIYAVIFTLNKVPGDGEMFIFYATD